MVLFNYATKELTAKIVYYGPGLCGKTTNLQWIHGKVPIKNKGKMLSLATETDRTLFFDFLPIELGTIRGMRTRMQLYTVPGQVFYNATRRMVLKGADCVVFVADSQEPMLEPNLESLENLRQNLVANELDPESLPLLLQYNKRDLPNALPVEILNERLNPRNLPYYEAVALRGDGVEQTLKAATSLVFKSLSSKYSTSSPPLGDVTPAAMPPRQAPAPAAERPALPAASPNRLAARETVPHVAARTIPPAPLEEEIPEELLESLDEEPPAPPAPRPRPPSPNTAEVRPLARRESDRTGSLADIDPGQTVAHEGPEVDMLRRSLKATGGADLTLEEVADEEEMEESFEQDFVAPSPPSPITGVVKPLLAADSPAAALNSSPAGPGTQEVVVPVNVNLRDGAATVRIQLVLNITLKP